MLSIEEDVNCNISVSILNPLILESYVSKKNICWRLEIDDHKKLLRKIFLIFLWNVFIEELYQKEHGFSQSISFVKQSDIYQVIINYLDDLCFRLIVLEWKSWDWGPECSQWFVVWLLWTVNPAVWPIWVQIYFVADWTGNWAIIDFLCSWLDHDVGHAN